MTIELTDRERNVLLQLLKAIIRKSPPNPAHLLYPSETADIEAIFAKLGGK